MITIGAHYRGPEFEGALLDKLVMATAQGANAVCGRWPEGGIAPWINVVFYVPGSLGGFGDHPEIKAGRFSRKQKLFLVAVLVSEEAKAAPTVEYVVDILHRSCKLGAEVFAQKGIEGFELVKAEAVVDKMKDLIRQKFDAMTASGNSTSK
jgi:hypothetical protein